MLQENNSEVQKHLILGTAGHIDHGKTSLIEALTGKNCDTHKEENQRGITIHLGFSHIKTEHGLSIGVVDVPGHAAFIRTMVSGAGGIDFFLLVIAADSGVMPQTHEHLQIMQILGVKRGIIAITKTDLVDEPILMEILLEEIASLQKEYPVLLNDAPIVKVSSKNNSGIEYLKKEIVNVAHELKNRNRSTLFRMFIDRIFVVKGFGSVVTGSVLGGKLSKGSSLYLLPSGKKLRARGIQHHGMEVDSVEVGDRASINISGLSRADFSRGMQITDRELKQSKLIDVTITLFKQCPPVGIWFHALFYLGTIEVQVRIHTLSCNRAVGGDTLLAQIFLPTSYAFQAQDHFVIRSTSSDVTIGGGTIIDPFPLHHRRRPEQLISQIQALSTGDLTGLVASYIRRQTNVVSIKNIGKTLNMSMDECISIISSDKLYGVKKYLVKNEWYLQKIENYYLWKEMALDRIISAYRHNPLSFDGYTSAKLLASIGISVDPLSVSIMELILADVEIDGSVRSVDGRWFPLHTQDAIDPVLKHTIDSVDSFFRRHEKKICYFKILKEKYSYFNISEEKLCVIIDYLVRKNRIIPMLDAWMHRSVAHKHARRILGYMNTNKEPLTISKARDIINANRDVCLKFFDFTDVKKYTVRNENDRYITDSGSKWLESIQAPTTKTPVSANTSIDKKYLSTTSA